MRLTLPVLCLPLTDGGSEGISWVERERRLGGGDRAIELASRGSRGSKHPSDRSIRGALAMAHRLVRLVLVAGCVVGAAVAGARLAGAQGTPGIDRPMPYMQAMNRIVRLLQEQVKDLSQNRSTLSLVADLEWSTLSAKEAMPLRSTILPDVERQAMLVSYRRLFLKLVRQELDLEEALLNDDNVAAIRMVATIEETENEGHERFR